MLKFVDEYDLAQCILCGKCSGSCPISIKSQLQIRKLIHEAIYLENLNRIYAKNELWDCSACTACELRCPKGISPINLVRGMRSAIIEHGKLPTTIREALESVYKNKNPWGKLRTKRAEWASKVEIKNLAEGEQAQMLLYVGCTPAYHPRIQTVAKSIVNILHNAKSDFGFLGNAEVCCGNEVRRLGEEGLWELLVKENCKLFDKYGIAKMITISPHCYNTFKNEYPPEIEVQHYTQHLAELFDRGKLNVKNKLKYETIYHDPCYLGKINKVFDPPREILKNILENELIEFDRCKVNSLCCEGGGGRMWIESKSEERLAERRVLSAIDAEAEVIATSCPFCLTNLEDAVKTTDQEDKIRVADVAELVAEIIE